MSSNLTTDECLYKQYGCAVIVTYYPDQDFKGRVEAFRREFSSIVVVDNSDSDVVRQYLTGFLASGELLCNPSNLGVGAAFNAGVEHASMCGAFWVACFDQDSLILSGATNVYLSVLKECLGRDVIVGSNYNGRRNLPLVKRSADITGNSGFAVTTVISSGTVCLIESWQRLGGLNESYFIDSVDHEFCLRAKAQGFLILLTVENTIVHNIGLDNTGGIGVPLHAPYRKYYIFRNVVLTIKEYYLHYPLWCFVQLIRLFVEFFSIVFFEPEKKKRSRCAFLGLLHGLKGLAGALVNKERF